MRWCSRSGRIFLMEQSRIAHSFGPRICGATTTTFREEVPDCLTGWRATTKGVSGTKSTPRTGIPRRLSERPAMETSRVFGPDRPPNEANSGDDHDQKHPLRSAGRRQGGRLGHRLPGHGTTTRKGGWETQTHPHLPIPIPPLRGLGFTHSRRRGGLPDGQGYGRISDHPGSGFSARNGQGQAHSNSSALASTRTLADAQPEKEVYL